MSDFAARLRAEGGRRYHDRHPFHVAMHEGRLGRAQLRAWVVNRWYYQTRIPVKDALIVAKSEDPAFRRAWTRRLRDQDGDAPGEGGLALWARLARGLGVDEADLQAFRGVLPDVRAACDAYVDLVRASPLVVAVAASLTECFAPDLMSRRIEAWERHYPWVDGEALAYFRARVTQARRDGEDALAFVLAHASDAETQDRCVAALVKKTEILWALLDAVQAAVGLEPRPKLARKARLRRDPVRGEDLLLWPERGMRLGGSAMRILALCDGERTIPQIVAALAAGHPGAAASVIEADVRAFLARLDDRGLLES